MIITIKAATQSNDDPFFVTACVVECLAVVIERILYSLAMLGSALRFRQPRARDDTQRNSHDKKFPKWRKAKLR